MPHDSFYWSKRWRSTRAAHLQQHPWCAVCAALRIQTPATDVDHVKAKELVEDPYASANLRSLCKQHHSQKTIATEGAHRSKKRWVVHGEDGFPLTYGDE